MSANIYYLELIFISVNILQKQKLMKNDILTDILFLKKKDKKHEKQNLIVNLSELIQVMQKMVTIQIMKLVIQKYLLMSSKITKIKELEKEIREARNEKREIKNKK